VIEAQPDRGSRGGHHEVGRTGERHNVFLFGAWVDDVVGRTSTAAPPAISSDPLSVDGGLATGVFSPRESFPCGRGVIARC
jgi:hypothetical protein